MIAASLLLLACAHAAPGTAGSASPLSLGAGARGLGMGGALSAAGEHASALFSNPAGLSRIGRGEVSASFQPLFGGGSRSHFALGYPTAERGAFALALSYLEHGKLPGRDARGSPTGNFGLEQLRAAAAYGRALGRYLSGGISVHMDRAAVSGRSSVAPGGVFGLAFSPPQPAGLTLGLAAHDVVPGATRLGEDGDRPPPLLAGGIAFDHRFASRAGDRIVIEVGALSGLDGRAALRAGAEYTLFGTIAVRAGYDRSFPCAGLGVSYGAVALDYAAALTELGVSHRAEAAVRFGRTVAEVRRTLANDRAERARLEEQDRQRRIEAGVRRRITEEVDRERADTAAGLVRQAHEAAKKGDHAEAAATFERALVWQADNAEAQAGLAALRQGSDRREAQQKARAAARHRARARDHARAGRHEQAMEELARARALLPADPAVEKELKSAVEAWRRTLVSGRGSSRDEAETEAKVLDEAVGDFVAGRFREAAERLEALLSANPQNAAARSVKARVDAAIARAALPTPTPARGNREFADRLYVEGVRLYTAGRLTAAAAKFREAIVADPTHSESSDALLRCMQKIKSLEERGVSQIP